MRVVGDARGTGEAIEAGDVGDVGDAREAVEAADDRETAGTVVSGGCGTAARRTERAECVDAVSLSGTVAGAEVVRGENEGAGARAESSGVAPPSCSD